MGGKSRAVARLQIRVHASCGYFGNLNGKRMRLVLNLRCIKPAYRRVPIPHIASSTSRHHFHHAARSFSHSSTDTQPLLNSYLSNSSTKKPAKIPKPPSPAAFGHVLFIMRISLGHCWNIDRWFEINPRAYEMMVASSSMKDMPFGAIS